MTIRKRLRIGGQHVPYLILVLLLGMLWRTHTGVVTHGMTRHDRAVMAYDGESTGDILTLTVITRRPLLPHELLGVGRPYPFLPLWMGSRERAWSPSEGQFGASDEVAQSLDDAWVAANAVLGRSVDWEPWYLIEHLEPVWPASQLGLRVGDRVLSIESDADGMFAGATVWRDGQTVVLLGSPDIAADLVLRTSVNEKFARLTDGRPAMVVAERTSGPSGGLAHALEYLDALTAGDLTGGMVIAVTGTISSDGSVGAIGGVEFKAAAAVDADADVVFVPAENAEDALAVADGRVPVVAVGHLRDALRWLCLHGSPDACPLTGALASRGNVR